MAAFYRGDLVRATLRPLASPLAALWWAPNQVILVIGCSSVYLQLGRPGRRLLKMAAFYRGDLVRAMLRPLASPLATLWQVPNQVIRFNWM